MLTQTPPRAAPIIMALFALQPLVMGGWFALIPTVQNNLALSKSELAMALLGMSLAIVVTLQFAGRIIDQKGPRRIFMWVLPLQSAAVVLPLLAPSQSTLFLALLVLGATIAFLEVALNLYAGRLELALDRLIMNRCHGFWSLGLGAGSLAITLLIVSWTPLVALAVLGIVSAVIGVMAARALPRIPGTDEQAPAPRRRPGQIPKPVILVAILLIFVTMTEGAMADWAAVYMSELLPPEATHAGFAVTLYAAFVTLGRFLGDSINRRIGSVALARGTIVLALAGIAILSLSQTESMAYLGFALTGVGVSVAFPLGISAVAGGDPRYEAANIAVVTTLAITGFLFGPPLIGFLADAVNLRAGIAALFPGLILSFWLARHLKRAN